MNDEQTPVFQVNGVHKIFPENKGPVRILEDISFTVRAGESVAIVGASGCGKTTLLQMLAGLDTPTSGEIIFRGRNLQHLDWDAKSKLRNEGIGFVFQFHHLLPEFTTVENVALPAMIRGEKKNNAMGRALRALERTGITRQAHQPVSTLSGGERQLTSIARAISLEPEVILADEPTGDLDPENGERVADLLIHQSRKLRCTLLVVTHNHHLADKMDRVLAISSGAIHEHHSLA
jgi:lipoprotein-releasing system ATP-binding protein